MTESFKMRNGHRSSVPRSIDRESIDSPTLAVWIDDESEPMLLTLGGGLTKWVIGSNAEANLRIPHKTVADFHAVLSREGDKWRLIDEMARNNTYVNGKRFRYGYVGEGYRQQFGAADCLLIIPGLELS